MRGRGAEAGRASASSRLRQGYGGQAGLRSFVGSGTAEGIYRQLESVAQTGRVAEQLAAVLKNLLPGRK